MLRRNPVRIACLAAIVLLVVGSGAVISQTGGLTKLRAGEIVTVPAGETVEGDLYAFAGNVRVAGTINGDLVIGAGQVEVAGTVTGDILAGGGQVTVGGTVGGDVRVGGGTVTISGTVAEDVAVAGGTVSITSSGQVGQDVLASAGQLAIDGTVAGSVVASAGSYSRSGQIGGEEDVTIGGDDRPVVVPSAADRVFDAIRHFVVVLLVGALMLWFAPRWYVSLQSTLRSRAPGSAGWGIVGLIGYIALIIVIVILVVVLAVLLGLLTFAGLVAIIVVAGTLAIGVLSLALVVVAAYVADVIVGAAIASLIPQDERASRWQELGLFAAGAAVVVFLSSLPIVGPWAKLVVIVLGLGALLLVAGPFWRRPRPAASTVATPASAASEA